MSNRAITWAFNQDIRNSSAKFVLVVLADHADEAWSCYPGQATIARMTGMSERSVRRALEWLEEQGFITRERRSDARGRRTSDRYHLRPAARMSDGHELGEHGECPACGHRPDCPEGEGAPTPTGQNVRSTKPQVKSTGQNDHRPICPDLPDNLSGEPSEEPPVLPLEEVRAARRRKRRAPETEIPSDFSVSPEMRAWAAKNVPGVDVDYETQQFVDYWISRGERRRDWVASWRQWMRKQHRWGQERAQNPTSQRWAAGGHRPYRNADYGDNPDPWA